MKHILIVEDDHKLQSILYTSLQDFGVCTTASNLDEAYNAFEFEEFDIVIVDRGLPDGDGVELIEYLREISYKTKVVALTTKASLPEKIEGLELGADEYLPKPFAMAELKLRIKKLLYIDKLVNDDSIKIGSFEFYPTKGLLSIQDKTIQLRKKEAKILHCLLRYRNQVVTREMIINDVWGGTDLTPTETTLDVYIRRIRVLLQEYSRTIKTIRGFGYRFNDSMVLNR